MVELFAIVDKVVHGLLSTEDFWDGHSLLVLVLLLLVLVLDDDGEDVLVEESSVDEELLEFSLGPVFLEGGADNVLLESWDLEEKLTEDGQGQVFLEQGKSVQLTKSVGEDVRVNIDLLSGWLNEGGWHHSLSNGGQVTNGVDIESIDILLLLQLLDVIVQGSGGGGGGGESTLVLSVDVILSHVLLSLGVDRVTESQVVHNVLVYSSGHLTADSGDQHNSNKSLHDDDKNLTFDKIKKTKRQGQ